MQPSCGVLARVCDATGSVVNIAKIKQHQQKSPAGFGRLQIQLMKLLNFFLSEIASDYREFLVLGLTPHLRFGE